jgi:DNA-binding response OmpR family regulator
MKRLNTKSLISIEHKTTREKMLNQQERKEQLMSTLFQAIITTPNPYVHEQLVTWLSPHFQCTVLSSLSEAEERLDLQYPQVLLIDLNHLDDDGIAFVRNFRETHPTSPLVIVGIIENAAAKDIVAGLQGGLDILLILPIDREYHLAQILALVYDGHRPHVSPH